LLLCNLLYNIYILTSLENEELLVTCFIFQSSWKVIVSIYFRFHKFCIIYTNCLTYACLNVFIYAIML